MSILDTIGQLFSRQTDNAVRDFEQRNFGSILGLELKKAYDVQRVGIQGRPQYPKFDTASLFEWSRRNELVYACIEKICQAAQDPEPIVEVKEGDAWERDDAHRLRRLLMKPNPMDDWTSFVGAMMASMHIAGVFYAEIIRSNDKLPVQLWPLDPTCVYPIPGKGPNNSPIAAYEFKMGSERVRLKPEEILVWRNRTVVDKFHGLSPLAVALGSVDADQAQTDYVRAFFNNSGIPSGLLKFTNRNMTPDEMKAAQQKWASRYSRGGQMERGVAVLDQNAEYQQIGSGLDEIESDALRWQVETRICAVFGVPPVLAGAYVGLRWQNNRASAREAQTDFWINKMSPLFKSLRSFVQWNLLTEFVDIEKIFAGDVRMGWDMTSVTALQEDLDAMHDRARKNFLAGGLTQSEFREKIGEDADENGDFYLIPTTVNPATGELVMSRLERAAEEPEPAKVDDALDADEIDDTKVDEFDEIERKARALLTAGNGNGAAPTAAEVILRAFHDDLTSKSSQRARNLILSLANGTPENKTFDYDGLTLLREPNEVESKIDLKAIAQATATGSERIKGVLLKLRESLIKQSVDMLSTADPAKLHAVVLTPDLKFYKELRKELDRMYTTGRRLISAEAAANGLKRSRVLSEEKQASSDPDDDETLDRLSEVTVSRVINSVQSAAAGILATLATLGVTGDELRKRIGDEMKESSSAYVTGSAGAAANAAMQKGRAAEMGARADEIKSIQYSALLDANCCSSCSAEDGKEVASVDDMEPTTPNPDCEGFDKCRCMWVCVWI